MLGHRSVDQENPSLPADAFQCPAQSLACIITPRACQARQALAVKAYKRRSSLAGECLTCPRAYLSPGERLPTPYHQSIRSMAVLYPPRDDRLRAIHCRVCGVVIEGRISGHALCREHYNAKQREYDRKRRAGRAK